MKVLFWCSFLFIVYTYFLFPFVLWLIALFIKKENTLHKSDKKCVSVIIVARNEEDKIGKRLNNLLMQDYSLDSFEILVASDGSDDRTAEKVREIIQCRKESRPPVRLFELTSHKGKPYAINLLVSEACGEIIVFADSRQYFKPDVLRELAACFDDPAIGCVSGELFFQKDTTSEIAEEMGAYWRYEKKIRKLEAVTGSLIGATGAIYAIRRQLFSPLPVETILDDVLTPMRILTKGYQVVFCDRAVAIDIVSENLQKEWSRKLRTLVGNWQLLTCGAELFIKRRFFAFWAFISHKICRLLVPYALILLLVAGFFCREPFYVFFTVLQVFCYLIACVAYFFPRLRSYKYCNFICFFSVLNLAAGLSLFYFLSGNTGRLWNKDNGAPSKE